MGGPIPSLALGERLLDGLGHHVRGGVAALVDRPVVAALDRLDGVTLDQRHDPESRSSPLTQAAMRWTWAAAGRELRKRVARP